MSARSRVPLAVAGFAAALMLGACGEQSLFAPSKNRVDRTAADLLVTSIGDYTWIDANKNGIQDANELPLPNVQLNLYAGTTCSGSVIDTQLSDPISGYYLFAGMPAGTYSVRALTPAGYTPTTVGATGSTSANDSNPSCSTVTVADGDIADTIDFGYYQPTVTAQGCTPGYWKNHSRWPSPYVQSTLFSSVFSDAFPGKSLQQVLSLGGGGLNALGRHTVSALLNAGAIGTPNYGLTQAQVISQFNAAYASKVYDPTKNYFESLSDSYANVTCPLN